MKRPFRNKRPIGPFGQRDRTDACNIAVKAKLQDEYVADKPTDVYRTSNQDIPQTQRELIEQVKNSIMDSEISSIVQTVHVEPFEGSVTVVSNKQSIPNQGSKSEVTLSEFIRTVRIKGATKLESKPNSFYEYVDVMCV